MLSKIKHLVKNSKLLYILYYYGGSFLLRFIGMFVKTDPNLILFSSYGGRKFDDSPRVVYEYLQKNPVSPDHKYVWAFVNPEEYPQVSNKIRIDTPEYYLTALRARYWITNSSISRGLSFKKAATINILFEHGLTALKRIGSDVARQDHVFVSTAKENYDMVFVEGKYESPILSRLWQLDQRVFYATGLPRNDDLVRATDAEKAHLRQKIGIPGNKKVILYAPTFRDWIKDAGGRNVYQIPMDFEKWKSRLGAQYVLLINGHYAIAELLSEMPKDEFVMNVFGYPQLNDLLKITDVLISDYSSIVFDYSILERPIFCYGYDLNEYLENRGSYVDIHSVFCNGVIQNEDTLIESIETMDYEEQCRFTREQIKEKYLASYGDAARKAVEIIFGSRREQN